jgi:hypothetical protein
MAKPAAFPLLALLLGAAPLAAQDAPARYDTPQAAADAFIAALSGDDRESLLAIFGPEAEDTLSTGDPEEDAEHKADLLRAWETMSRVGVETGGDRAILYFGRDQWPFPIPLARGADGAWAFDMEAGRVEVAERRIGRNELDVMALMEAYVDVQADYRRTDWDGDGVMEFAEHILSSPGLRDGLYWPAEAGAPESPIGDFVARAAADGYVVDAAAVEPEPYLGYYYRILDAQGPAAPGGAMSYRVNGLMVAGHALLAFPADYGETGVASFLVGEAGVVYEADLGEETLDAALAIEAFDPDARWVRAN